MREYFYTATDVVGTSHQVNSPKIRAGLKGDRMSVGNAERECSEITKGATTLSIRIHYYQNIGCLQDYRGLRSWLRNERRRRVTKMGYTVGSSLAAPKRVE